MRRAAGIVFGLALFAARDARAAGPLPANKGDPIQTSAYSVDLFQGPILASSRVTALAGAYTALAEGAEAIPFNPAAASLRAPYSTTKADWDVTGGLTLPSSVTDTDFDNNGDTHYQTKNFVWGSLGGYVQYGHIGIGAIVQLQNYVLDQDPFLRIASTQPGQPDRGADQVIVRVFRADPVASYGFMDDQLHVGVGLRVAQFQAVGSVRNAPPGAVTNAQLTGDSSELLLFQTTAVGAQGGVLWAPYHLPIRIGGAVRSPLIGGVAEGGAFQPDASGDVRAGDFYLPKRIDLPWEVEGGFALQLWKRPLNIPWVDEDKVPVSDAERWRKTKSNGQIEPAYRGARRMLAARYRSIPREKVLIATSVIVSGPVPNAVGVESMLSKKLERSGQTASVGARVGVESEVVPYWLVLRGGSYLEPTRFATSSPRLHGTGGVQVRLFEWDVFGLFDPAAIWRLSTAVDFARQYFAWSVGVGTFM